MKKFYEFDSKEVNLLKEILMDENDNLGQIESITEDQDKDGEKFLRCYVTHNDRTRNLVKIYSEKIKKFEDEKVTITVRSGAKFTDLTFYKHLWNKWDETQRYESILFVVGKMGFKNFNWHVAKEEMDTVSRKIMKILKDYQESS